MLLLQNGWTALHVACRYGYTEVVQYLLTSGANLSATNKVNNIFTNCLFKITKFQLNFHYLYIRIYNHIMINK